MDMETLYQVIRRLRRYIEAAAADQRERPAPPLYQQLVLDDVIEHPGSTIQEITTRLAMAQSLISRAIAHARDEGWVITFVDPEDHRRTRVRPSNDLLAHPPAGIHADAECALAPLLCNLDAGDRAAFFRALEAIHLELCKTDSAAARQSQAVS